MKCLLILVLWFHAYVCAKVYYKCQIVDLPVQRIIESAELDGYLAECNENCECIGLKNNTC